MTVEQAIAELRSDIALYETEICKSGDGSPDGDLMEALEMAIAALEHENRWISVNDALPKIDVRVIVYCDDPFDIPPHFPRRKLLLIGYLDMENNWYDSDGPLENITHWMPLPMPPEVTK